MLVLSRKLEESIVIDGHITVKVIEVRAGRRWPMASSKVDIGPMVRALLGGKQWKPGDEAMIKSNWSPWDGHKVKLKRTTDTPGEWQCSMEGQEGNFYFLSWMFRPVPPNPRPLPTLADNLARLAAERRAAMDRAGYGMPVSAAGGASGESPAKPTNARIRDNRSRDQKLACYRIFADARESCIEALGDDPELWCSGCRAYVDEAEVREPVASKAPAEPDAFKPVAAQPSCPFAPGDRVRVVGGANPIRTGQVGTFMRMGTNGGKDRCLVRFAANGGRKHLEGIKVEDLEGEWNPRSFAPSTTYAMLGRPSGDRP